MPVKIEVTEGSIKRKTRSSEPNPFADVITACVAELAKLPATTPKEDRASRLRTVSGVSDPKKAINALRRAAKDANVSALTEPVNETSFKFQVVDKITRKPREVATAA